MAKTYYWEIPEDETLHKVALTCSPLTGKAIITIDGTEFNISVRPLTLRGTQQMFRLGEMPAMLNFPKSGAPEILLDGGTCRTVRAEFAVRDGGIRRIFPAPRADGYFPAVFQRLSLVFGDPPSVQRSHSLSFLRLG